MLGAAALYQDWAYAAGNLFLSNSGLLPWNKYLLAAELHLWAQFPSEGIQGKFSHMNPSYESKSKKFRQMIGNSLERALIIGCLHIQLL